MSDTESVSKASGKKSPPQGSSFKWVTDGIRSPRTLKTWFRACVVLITVLVLMVDKDTSNAEGQVAFFTVIVSFMLPPNIPLSIFLMAVLTLLLGMLIGWAWGSVAMAAGFAVRSPTLLAQQQLKLESSLGPGIPVDLQIENQIFHGIFLDPRTSAVYGAFIFIGNFALGSLRAYAPNLRLLSVFGGIIITVMATIGPLLPIADYTLPKVLIIPTCCYAAVAITSLIVIFPQSLSHFWLTSLEQDFWTPLLDLLRIQSEALSSTPSDRDAWRDITSRSNEVRAKLVQGTDALSKQISLINFDFSICRLGPADLQKMDRMLKSITFRATGLNSFNVLVNETNTADEQEEKTAELLSRDDATPGITNRYQTLMRKIREREAQHGHDLDTLIPIIASSSVDLRSVCNNGVNCVIDWFRECNNRRWANYFSKHDAAKAKERHDKLVDQWNELQAALEEFRSVHRTKLLQPYERFFDPQTKRLLNNDEKEMFASKSLFICFVFIDTLDAFTEQLLHVLRLIIDLDTKRPQPRIWSPCKLSKVKDKIAGDEFTGSAEPYSIGTATDPTSFDSPSSTSDSVDDDSDQEAEENSFEPPKKRNPDALTPTTVIGRFFVKLVAVLRFLKSPQGIFAFRVATVSLALWIPAVCHSTAWLYFDVKGLWALIMAQITLAVYAGDQIAGLIIQFTGTAMGLLLGLVVWYIGAGRGSGNPYGIVIATTVFLSPCILVQIAGPPTQKPLWTMMATTLIFVVGYSWVNANQMTFGNPGVGISLGWKRALLVVIGFTSGFIVMLFPNFVSSRVLVRKSLAAVTREIGNILAEEVEVFLAEEARARRGVYEKGEFIGNKVDSDARVSRKERRVSKIARRVITVMTRLRGLAPSLTTAKYEPQLSGIWPHAQYQALFGIQMQIMGALILLICSFAKLDTTWCSILVHQTPFLNPNFLSDIFTTLSVLSNSLLTGQPLPAYLPKLRDRVIYHEFHKGRYPHLEHPKKLELDSTEDLEKRQDDSSNEEGLEYSPEKVDGSSIGFEELSLDVLMDEQLPVHSTAIIALSGIITRIDEIADIVRTLCGEATFRGYENLQRDDLDREEKVHGSGFASRMK